MSAVIAAFPGSAASPQNIVLPEMLQNLLAQGETIRRSRFDDGGFVDVREEWRPPARIPTAAAALARQTLEALRRGPLAPASPNHLLARILALLSHYPAKAMTAEVEQMIALDWAEDLGEFPAWAVDHAARVWRRSRKWRPSIAEMRALCLEACAAERRLAERLAALAAAGETQPAANRRGVPVMGALRRMG